MRIYRSLPDLMGSLQMAGPPASWHRNWDAVIASFPGDGSKVPFLGDGYALEANRILQLTAPMMDDLLRALALIRGRLDLSLLAWLWHYVLILKRDPLEASDVPHWPLPLGAMGPLAGMLPLTVVLSGLPGMQRIYAERQLPASLLEDTISEVRTSVDFHAAHYGHFGLHNYICQWLLGHLQGSIFLLGRFNYRAGVFHESIRALRHRVTGEVRTLAEDGVRFRADGHVDGTNGIYDHGEGAWMSTLREDDEAVEGNPIGPMAQPTRERVRLLKSEWGPLLSRGDAVIEVHIPLGGRMYRELCLESHRQACEFFRTQYPDSCFRAFTCSSWLLDPQLQQFLPPTSNIVAFQEDFCLFPVLSDDYQVFENINANNRPADLHDLPVRTSLQRAIRAWLLQGGQLHEGGGFIPLHHGPSSLAMG